MIVRTRLERGKVNKNIKFRSVRAEMPIANFRIFELLIKTALRTEREEREHVNEVSCGNRKITTVNY